MKRINLSSKRGFTLIELLVVIGILAVLTAIAIPSVAGLIDRANVSADKTNSNEMTNSMERFASEYELYCQDIAAGKIKNTANLDGAQGRVYNVTKATTRGEIEQLESEDGFNGRAIDGDTNYPTNRETARAIVQVYTKTSSSIFEPKQSDAHYYYSPDCGVVVAQDTAKSDVASLNALISSGLDASGKILNDNTIWIDLTDESASCGIEGHFIGDGKNKHGILATKCLSGHKFVCECECWTVPAGCTYYVHVGSVSVGDFSKPKEIYNAGEQLPCGYKSQYLDAFVDGDYEYRFNAFYYGGNNWGSALASDGWGVRVIDKTKTHYKELIPVINNKKICSMRSAFQGCNKLEIAPTIPDNIHSFSETFAHCTSLKTAPKLSDKTYNLYHTFYGCTSLTGTFTINGEISTYTDCFKNVDFKNQNLTLSGVSSNIDDIGLTGNNYCSECNGTCKSNH